jgi:hypothetical protein
VWNGRARGSFGTVGFLSGAAFGLLLSFGESRKTILNLSLSRVAMWGILGAAAFPLLTTAENELAFIFCPLGATFATASVTIARKAELHAWQQPELLSSEPRSIYWPCWEREVNWLRC